MKETWVEIRGWEWLLIWWDYTERTSRKTEQLRNGRPWFRYWRRVR